LLFCLYHRISPNLPKAQIARIGQIVTMNFYRYRIVNVFVPENAASALEGNALCVVEPHGSAPSLSTAQMLDIARQFNLSETTFLAAPAASSSAHAAVRIFTPGYEMRFAGHPTLGSAAVVQSLQELEGQIRLEFPAGVVAVRAQGAGHFQFQAPTGPHPAVRPAAETPEAIAAMLGLQREDMVGQPCWVDAGTDQLLVPVCSEEAVRAAEPDSAALANWPLSSLGRKTAYVFHLDPLRVNDAGELLVSARYFFTSSGSGVIEDPGTGSACANLGAWLLANASSLGLALPIRARVDQGRQVQRPCELTLEVNLAREILVGGRVLEVGHGQIRCA
jgi:trans-2,3-dihydro-3-hydroxyanthranilate isomerase